MRATRRRGSPKACSWRCRAGGSRCAMPRRAGTARGDRGGCGGVRSTKGRAGRRVPPRSRLRSRGRRVRGAADRPAPWTPRARKVQRGCTPRATAAHRGRLSSVGPNRETRSNAGGGQERSIDRASVPVFIAEVGRAIRGERGAGAKRGGGYASEPLSPGCGIRCYGVRREQGMVLRWGAAVDRRHRLEVYWRIMQNVRAINAGWIRTRVCPSCGYAGDELQRRRESSVFECPLCDADLYARPARSYAEMEGFGSEDIAPVAEGIGRGTGHGAVSRTSVLASGCAEAACPSRAAAAGRHRVILPPAGRLRTP